MIARLLVLVSVAALCDARYYWSSPIQAAIKSLRTVDLRPVSLEQDPIYTQVIEVAPLELPIQIVFNSRSSPVLVHQNHIPGAPGQVEKTTSKEEPHVVVHEVIRPVIQELRERITPYRRVVQEVAPVVETINTVVSKGEKPASAHLLAPVSGSGPVVSPDDGKTAATDEVAPVVAALQTPVADPVVSPPVDSVQDPVVPVSQVSYEESSPLFSPNLRKAAAAAASRAARRARSSS